MDLIGDKSVPASVPDRDPAVMEVLEKFLGTNKRLSSASEAQRRLFERLERLQRGKHGSEQGMGDLRGVHENEHESNSQVEDVSRELWETELEAIAVEGSRLQKEVRYLTDQREVLLDEFDEVCKHVHPYVLENDAVWDRLQTEQKILEFWASKVSSEVEELVRKLEECGCVGVENQRWEATQSQSISQSESTECSEEVSIVASSARKLSGSELSEELDSIVDCLKGSRLEVDRNDLKKENEEKETEGEQMGDIECMEGGERLGEECLFTIGTPKGGFSPKGRMFFRNRMPELFDSEKEHGIVNSGSLELNSGKEGERGNCADSDPRKVCGEPGAKKEDSKTGDVSMDNSKCSSDGASPEESSLAAEVKSLKEAKCELEGKLQEMTAIVNDVRKRLEVAVKAKTEMEARMSDMESQMKSEEDNLLALKENLQGVAAAKRSLHSKVIYAELENKRLREELAEKEEEEGKPSGNNGDWVCNSPSQEMEDQQRRRSECEAPAAARITRREIESMTNAEDGERSGVVKWAVRLGGSFCGSIIAGKLLNGLLRLGGSKS